MNDELTGIQERAAEYRRAILHEDRVLQIVGAKTEARDTKDCLNDD